MLKFLRMSVGFEYSQNFVQSPRLNMAQQALQDCLDGDALLSALRLDLFDLFSRYHMTVSLYQWGKVTSHLRKLTVVLVRMLTFE